MTFAIRVLIAKTTTTTPRAPRRKSGVRQRVTDRVTGRKSDRPLTNPKPQQKTVIQRASPSPNDDPRASPEPEPARFFLSLFAGGTTRERRASSAARASAAVRGTPPKGTSVSTVAPPLARLAADARNPKGRNPPGSGNCDESGPSAPRREEWASRPGRAPRARDRAGPRRAPTARERPGHLAPARRAPSRRLGGAPMGSRPACDSGSGATRGAPLAKCPFSGASASARGSVTSATLSPGFG